jgi:hypothetical protein
MLALGSSCEGAKPVLQSSRSPHEQHYRELSTRTLTCN